MTGFTMPCCASRPDTFGGRLLARVRRYGWLLLCLVAPAVLAADISVRNPQIALGEDGYVVSADFNVNFNARLEEAVNRGVVLYFTVDFELSKSRWYWFDEQIIKRSRTYQLYYHALTRQYRLSTGGLHQSYPTLDEALRVMSRLHNWLVIEKGEVRVGQTGTAGLRMHLDLTQLPKTFQVSALSNKDWDLASEWVHWNFLHSEAAPVSAAAPLVPGAGAAATGDGR